MSIILPNREFWGKGVAAVDGGILPSGQHWGNGTPENRNILKCLDYAYEFMKARKNEISKYDFNFFQVVFNPGLALVVAQSKEVQDFIANDSTAKAQAVGDIQNKNGVFVIPSKIYQYKFVIEKHVQKKEGDASGIEYCMSDRAVAYLIPEITGMPVFDGEPIPRGYGFCFTNCIPPKTEV